MIIWQKLKNSNLRNSTLHPLNIGFSFWEKWRRLWKEMLALNIDNPEAVGQEAVKNVACSSSPWILEALEIIPEKPSLENPYERVSSCVLNGSLIRGKKLDWRGSLWENTWFWLKTDGKWLTEVVVKNLPWWWLPEDRTVSSCKDWKLRKCPCGWLWRSLKNGILKPSDDENKFGMS